MITKETTIEELVERYPLAVEFLSEKGIRCIRCGEAVWGTLEEAAQEKGFDSNDTDYFILQLNSLLSKIDPAT